MMIALIATFLLFCLFDCPTEAREGFGEMPIEGAA